MKKIGLVIDEGSDLPKEFIDNHEISVIPFKFDLGEMKDLPGNIYQKIEEAQERGIRAFIKTSQPSIGEFLSVFKEKLKNFSEVVCITISSKLSGTFNSAIQARNFLTKDVQDKISIIDSLNGTGGEGLLIIRVVDFIKKGLGVKAILDDLKEVIEKKIHLIGMLGDPKWFEASGRLPHFIAIWISRMQKMGLRPLIGLKRGIIKPIGIKRGVKDTAEALFQEFENRIARIKNLNYKIKVAITHAGNIQGAEKLKQMIQSLKNTEIAFVNIIGTAIGGHVGPGTLILSWQEF